MQMIARNALRQSALASRQPVLRMSARSVHIENTVNNNMPFSYTNKPAFATKVAVFFVSGFSIPFIAAAWQLHKSAA
ncbi:uncharacterized protein L969DRAFT_19708 [Mixia osmundae IAM 14324]|uniref:Cytochrome c oxidase subunit 8, mitochondrial n=1 Tax=Mixia osmundae (strain CBS 9802 / IAM 14324 / JCM 22182 / KY 12970) TaxID=764103 RepID=G7DZJ1_MIXOS|nr:uncharacterized protein L969DRAFT_19708 [Mixia osmundae IAM 14324]KEI37173.1 hypothetical protein L969DRAFT_19708 [Mixia osmundae IAM 14324]GAA96001.1 hypothetical protein E5Q_02661 [Mixia osmundae IAM 14324]